MKRVQVSEIASVLEEVQKGETFEVVDGEKPVAKLSPPEEDPRKRVPTLWDLWDPPDDNDPQKELKERIEQLIAEGKMRPPTAKLAPDFFRRPLARLPDGLTGSGAVLEEREESPW